jgi:glycosyltransferase involved in cell wall biosynthesis
MENSQKDIKISIVIPVLNEEESVIKLYESLTPVLQQYGQPYEIIYVDDGSTDKTPALVSEIPDNHVILIRLRRRFGQTAAMSAGIHYAKGETIIMMDGDLQNDPQDIPRLMAKMDEGYDIVSGWRKDRKDKYWTRIFPSKIANWLIGAFTGVKLHDYGCSLKAYHKDVIKDLKLYGEMHRFIPALASWYGAQIAEIPVIHHPRQFGKSKYSLSRITRVVLDLMTVKFLLSFVTKPLQIFGLLGLGSFSIGTLICLYLTFIKFVFQVNIGGRPLLLLGILMLMAGIQFITLGLLAEMISRTYFESQNKPIYVIREVVRRDS